MAVGRSGPRAAKYQPWELATSNHKTKYYVMIFKIPCKNLRCQAPLYNSVAELVNMATNHPELISSANYSDDEYIPEDKLDAIDHIQSVFSQQLNNVRPSGSEAPKESRESETPEEASESIAERSGASGE